MIQSFDFFFFLLLLLINSTQDCFKAAWSSHKSVHVKAQLSSIANSLPGDQNSDLVSQGWLYCVRRGQGRTHKLPHFDWTGLVSSCVILFQDRIWLWGIQVKNHIFCCFLCRPLKQYLISPKRFVPAEIEKPDWAIDVSPYLFFSCTSISLAKLDLWSVII